MRHVNEAQWKGVRKAINELTVRSNTIFDRAPVMMHMIGTDEKLVKVNCRWTQGMGYAREEAVGRRTTEFLTEESRRRAVDMLPMFWRVGFVRSVGFRFVRKDDRVLDVLLDAEVITLPGGDDFSYTTISDVENFKQWEQASATIKALQELAFVRQGLESVLSALESNKKSLHSPEAQQSPEYLLDRDLAEKALGSLLEVAEDISTNLRVLRVLPEVHEEWLGGLVEQQQELLLVAKNIDSTLGDLADRRVTPPKSG